MPIAGACGSSRSPSDDGDAGTGGTSSHGGDVAGGGAGGQAGAGRGGSPAGTGGFVACPGSDPTSVSSAGCRSTADCSFGTCVWSEPVYTCGPVGFASPQCTTDASCGDGKICELAPYQSCGNVAQCFARCTAGSCDNGQVCNSDTGHCDYVPCGSAWPCAADETCLPSVTTVSDPHGCAPALCELYGGTYACPSGTACSMSYSDQHGCQSLCSVNGCSPNYVCEADESCQPKKCKADADCDCGVCASGTCKNTFGFCSYGSGGTSG
ncbi:MAG TPA: hypothetical protein VMI54_27160 [Polyangiaceae bacterium]|nr:hypothetical protein [Polyangiaceae bacterium]